MKLKLAKDFRLGKVATGMLRDLCWVKARIGARILLRAEAGRLTARDIRLAERFGKDKAVEDRLLYQALANIRVQKRRRNQYVPAKPALES